MNQEKQGAKHISHSSSLFRANNLWTKTVYFTRAWKATEIKYNFLLSFQVAVKFFEPNQSSARPFRKKFNQITTYFEIKIQFSVILCRLKPGKCICWGYTDHKKQKYNLQV